VLWTRAGEWGSSAAWAQSSEQAADWTPEELWRAYIQLTEAEDAFHIQKSDLQIRPVWHQKAERVQAHILVCFLACVLWKTLEAQCRQAGLGDKLAKSSAS
jgi:transposase